MEIAAVSLERSQNLEHFLSQITGKQLQGLPVGPFASIVLAEGCLTLRKMEQQARAERVNQMFNQIAEDRGRYWYEDFDSEDEAQILTQAQKDSFVGLFNECVKSGPLHLGLARHLLRNALKRRTNSLVGSVLDNLEALTPALRDVIRYLIVAIPKADADGYGAKILAFSRDSAVGALPFVRMWLLELIYRRPDLCTAAQAFALAEESSSYLGHRPAALMASAYKQIDWVRSRKETWRAYEPWSRRALIWSASSLPSGERRPFLAMVAEQGDKLEAALAKYLLASV